MTLREWVIRSSTGTPEQREAYETAVLTVWAAEAERGHRSPDGDAMSAAYWDLAFHYWRLLMKTAEGGDEHDARVR